jgi:hypothetical protein
MALLAVHPPELIPNTLQRLIEACGAVAAGASAVAARHVAALAHHRFSIELAEALVLRVLLPQVAMGSDMTHAYWQVRDLAVSLVQAR